jgi:hypothetical protein
MTTEPWRFALHAKQAEVFRSRKRFRVVCAGRRIGKTYLARVELNTRALRGGKGRYWYVAPTLKAAKDIMWDDLKESLHPSWVEKVNESELSIRLRNGAELRLHGADNPDDLVGRGLRFAVLDEFADMKPDAWERAIRPALADYRAPALFIGTPKSFNHFHALFERGQSTDDRWRSWASWQFKSIDNPTLDPQEIEEARQTTDPRTFRQEWEASFEAVAGRAYYAFDRQQHRRAVHLQPGPWVGLAFDFNVQPSTGVIFQRIGDECHVWREIWIAHAGGEATRAAALRAKELLQSAGWTGQLRIYGDASGQAAKTTGPADHAVLREVFPHAQWYIPKANPHVRDRVAAVNARCQTMDGKSHLVVDPACEHLIADLEQVVFADNGDLDKKRNPLLTHISDAFGYAVAQEWPLVQRGGVGMATVGWL